MQTLTQIKQLLADHGLTPRKSLGQNFLIDANLARKLVEASGVGPSSLVLEVGPGTGVLTEALLETGSRVIACELDASLAALLRDRLGQHPGFTLIEGDCLARKTELNPALAEALGPGPFTLVANLPYGAATPLMLTLLTRWSACTGQFVTIQQEVADRLRAGPAAPKAYGAISIVAQALAQVRKVATLGPECFWPRPDVTSAMVALVRRPDPLEPDPARWPDLARAASALFEQRRKQLGSTLRRLGATQVPLPPGVRPEQRPEELTVEQAAELCRALAGALPPVP